MQQCCLRLSINRAGQAWLAFMLFCIFSLMTVCNSLFCRYRTRAQVTEWEVRVWLHRKSPTVLQGTFKQFTASIGAVIRDVRVFPMRLLYPAQCTDPCHCYGCTKCRWDSKHILSFLTRIMSHNLWHMDNLRYNKHMNFTPSTSPSRMT